MANILHAIRDALVLRPEVRHRVGSRIFASRAPQDADMPYITLSRITGEPEYDLQGDLGTMESVVQIDVWADKPIVRDEIADEVRRMLSGFRGLIGGEDSQVFVNGSLMERDNDIEERPVDASDEWVFRSSRDFRIVWQQSEAPTVSEVL